MNEPVGGSTDVRLATLETTYDSLPCLTSALDYRWITFGLPTLYSNFHFGWHCFSSTTGSKAIPVEKDLPSPLEQKTNLREAGELLTYGYPRWEMTVSRRP